MLSLAHQGAAVSAERDRVPLELLPFDLLIEVDSFLPEQADTGRMKGAHCEAVISHPATPGTS